MRKLLAIGMLFTCIWAVNAQAGIYRHVVKPVAGPLVKGVGKSSLNIGKGVSYPVRHPKKSAKAVGKVIY